MLSQLLSWRRSWELPLLRSFTHGFGLSNASASGQAVTSRTSGPPVKINYVSVKPTVSGFYDLPRPLVLSRSELDQLNGLITGSGYDGWFRERGALDVGTSVVKILVQGNRSSPVQVVNMSAVKHCTLPAGGTLFENSPTGGAVDVLGMALNIDTANPIPQNGLMAGNWFNAHTVSLGLGETQTLVVVVNSYTFSCSYKLTMTVVAGSRTQTVVISNQGKPFQIAGSLPLCRYKDLYIGGTTPGVTAPFKPKNPKLSSCLAP
jgi:hypothetical protein